MEGIWELFSTFLSSGTMFKMYFLVVFQFHSHVWLFCDSMDCPLSLNISWSLPKFISIASVMHQPSHPLPPFSSALSLSHHQRLFQWVGCLHQVTKILELQHQSFQWVLRFLKIDWFDLLAFQGILRSLLQHHGSKASILWHFAFFMVQLSQPYMTAGKTIALTIPLLAEYHLCFSTHCLGLSYLSCQEAVIFWFRGYSHHTPWF